MIGAFIRDVRESRGLSQVQLADIAGVSQPNLSAYENGHRVPTADTLNRIVVVCGYLLSATAGHRRVTCAVPRISWFPDDDDPPTLPDDPIDEPPTVTADTPLDERVRVITALLDR